MSGRYQGRRDLGPYRPEGPRTAGKLILYLFASLAEFKLDLFRERTNAGLAAARARGRTGGRPRVKAFRDPATLALAKQLYYEQHQPAEAVCQLLGISRPTFYRYLANAEVEP